jgi:hypothetical protein
MLGVVTRQDEGEQEHDALIDRLVQAQRARQIQEAQEAQEAGHEGEKKKIDLDGILDNGGSGSGSGSSPEPVGSKWTSSWWHQFVVLSIRSSKQQRGETVGQVEMSGIAVLYTIH